MNCPSLPRTVLIPAQKVLQPENPPVPRGWLFTLFYFPEPIATAGWDERKHIHCHCVQTLPCIAGEKQPAVLA